MDEKANISRRRLLAGAGIALSGAVAGCTLGTPQNTEEDARGSDRFPSEFDGPPENPDQPVADSELSTLYEDVVDSVAAVRIEAEEGTASGTGWVYDHTSGDYVVTNEHVVRDNESPFLWFDNTGWREGTVVGTDFYSDLAVIDVLDGLPGESTGLSLVEAPVPVGTEVVAIGNPFGLTGSFTTGIVSGRNRNIRLGGRTFSIADGIQTDAAVNRGNSGGPLVTHEGTVAGVVNAGSQQGDNVGFAISARMTRRVVPDLITEGAFEHSRMGVLLTDVTPELIEANELPVTYGVYIDRVQDDVPADEILRGTTGQTTVRGRDVSTGGDVIVGLSNGDTEWATPTTERLSAFLALYTEPGDTIGVDVVRDGERRTVEITLVERPPPPSRA